MVHGLHVLTLLVLYLLGGSLDGSLPYVHGRGLQWP